MERTKLKEGEHKGVFHDFTTGKTFVASFKVTKVKEEEKDLLPVLDLRNHKKQ